MTMAEIWHLLQSGPGAAPYNMAFDEALLAAMPQLGKPVLRFYGWTEAAATFGYSQKYAEVAQMTSLRPLIRRPTGGGLVPHDADWTYSLFLPRVHEWYAVRAPESYRRLHQWLSASFERIGVRTELSTASRKEMPGQCFAGPDQHDLLQLGRKICGAAQRRSRQGLLIQGSVRPPAGIAKADWQQALCDGAHFQWGVEWVTFEPDKALNEQAAQLVREKYSQAAYNQKR
jgi:lipoate-protein ligase A